MTRLKAVALALTVVLLAALPVWMGAQDFSRASNYTYWVDPGNCNTSTTGTRATGSGQATAGTAKVPTSTIIADPAGEGTTTETWVCTITPPSWIVTTGTGLAIQDAVFMLGPQTILGSQSATLASGTLNSAIVFASVTYPAAAIGETPSTVTPVRADSGTLTISPVAGSFPTTTTTAGSFYSIKFTPATPIAWKTDLKQLLLTVTVNTGLAGVISTGDSSGVLVHFKSQ